MKNPCGCNLADCVACNEWNGSAWERYEEDGPMDLEDQLEVALDAAFTAQKACDD